MAGLITISPQVEQQIRQCVPWTKLPASVKESLGNNASAYDRCITNYSIANQLVWRSNLVRHVVKNERKYYEDVTQHCRNNLMLYPYHLQDPLCQGLNITPFLYCRSIFELIMLDQKSYDSVPNFTARDCYRLMGIGRNEYIDMMNKYRSKRFWRKRSPLEFLPASPLEDVPIQPWWIINVGFVTEEEVARCTPEEHKTIDTLISKGCLAAGLIDARIVRSLYTKQIIYFAIVIQDDDYIVVPPLKGFVMNRVQGDYFENLLYKVFVTINEHTKVSELASVLQTSLQEVKNAISVFIRLGFAHKKSVPDPSKYHETWKEESRTATSDEAQPVKLASAGLVMEDFTLIGSVESDTHDKEEQHFTSSQNDLTTADPHAPGFRKRIGFLFDSTLTAFLMMGNLSPGLKNHAVTMFEVGKLTDEALDSFMVELDRVEDEPEGEGEAQRYFQHAVTLRSTIHFLRHNSLLSGSDHDSPPGLDLLHCESMNKLDQGTLNRLMQKNYCVLVSMAPLSQETISVSSCNPPHIGPSIPEMNSIWFRLWLYNTLKSGPTSLLLTRGTRLTVLPSVFKGYRKLVLTSWGHDPAVVNTSNLLLSLNEALTHSPVLIQAYGWRDVGKLEYVTFPFERLGLPEDDIVHHPALKQLETITDLSHTCGYITMLNTGAPHITTNEQQLPDPSQKARQKEISEFLEDLRELGIGEQPVAPSAVKPHPLTAKDNEEQEEMSPAMCKLLHDWVPLELSFGIPLFDDEANHSVSDKIVSHNLFAQSSLENLTKVNRLIALDVMDFIAQYQDGEVYNHTSSDTKSDTHSIPLPTTSLLFHNGTLCTFDR